MYPGLPYMERIAMKADVIPLREPVQLPNGDTITELPVYPGQVRVPSLTLEYISCRALTCLCASADGPHPHHRHPQTRLRMEGRRHVPPGALAWRPPTERAAMLGVG